MSVRALLPTDFDDALVLYRHLTRDPVPVSTSFEAFRTVLAHTGTTVFGFEQKGRIISMITLHLLPNMTSGGRPYGLVENVVTDPAYRGVGAGRAVLTAVTDHARAAGAYKVMLLTGSARGARGFYEKLGFSDAEKHGMVLRL
ncbi:GNAT family N-acetyltransferase [uncultured Sulfitobacter sp.]|uniref:GNAT family N-acetyltransferase n=1 Tax=uncultured Sulfitobacter sp. TaxID=191468 RepID=UPI0026025EB6|nr:GNAT family N-acetyltransferase [uncultured Sulfitobacter sp.]